MVAANNSHIVGGVPNLEIEEIYVIVGKGPDGEGIMGCNMQIAGQTMMTPLVGSKESIKTMVKMAKKISKDTGTKFKIYRFSQKEDVTHEFV